MGTTTTSSLSTPKIITRTAVITAALAMPFLVHLLPPIFGSPAGAVLLPMFYAPLVAAGWRMKSVTGIALFWPLINLLIIGMPEPATTFILTFEVGLFLLAAWNRSRLRIPSWLTGPLAYLIAKAGSFAAISIAFLAGLMGLNPVEFVIQSLTNGWPGLILLTVLSGWIFKQGEGTDQ